MKRILGILLAILMLIGSIPLSVSAEPPKINNGGGSSAGSGGGAYEQPEVEVIVSADATANNLDLTGVDKLLKDKLEELGVQRNKVHVNSANVSYIDSNFNWVRVDHTNVSTLAENTGQRLVQYYNDPYISQRFDYHIDYQQEEIRFYGYGMPAYKDFLYTDNDTGDNKVFTFTLDESKVNYHSAEGFGFLFNSEYTYSAGSRYLTGYMVLFSESAVAIYQLVNINVNNFASESGTTIASAANLSSAWGGKVTRIVSVNKPAATAGSKRHIKIVSTPNVVSVYQFTDETHSVVQNRIIDQQNLPVRYNNYGFGPISTYVSHSCSILTQIGLQNFKMSTDSSSSLTDVIMNTTWKFDDSIKIIANVDNDGVSDLDAINSLSNVLYYMGRYNVHYVGWGLNNTISGSYPTVKQQAEAIVARNLDRGVYINRSEEGSATLKQGADKIAEYISKLLEEIPSGKPGAPNTTVRVTGGNAVVSVTDTATSLGNTIGEYVWRWMDVATGTWNNQSGNTPGISITLNEGKYYIVSVKIKDSVTSQFSDEATSFVTLTQVDPLASFSIDKKELFNISEYPKLNMSDKVKVTNFSYSPSGAELVIYNWSVYNEAYVEQDKGIISGSESEPEFDFSNLARGKYTIRLTVTDENGRQSDPFVQTVVKYVEDGSGSVISIAKASQPFDNNYTLYKDGVLVEADITGDISGAFIYRAIRLSENGEVSAGKWYSLESGGGRVGFNLEGGEYDLYLQVIKVDNSSIIKTRHIGFYSSQINAGDIIVPTVSIVPASSSVVGPNTEMTMNASDETELYKIVLEEKGPDGWQIVKTEIVEGKQGTLSYKPVTATTAKADEIEFRVCSIDRGLNQSNYINVMYYIDTVIPSITGFSPEQKTGRLFEWSAFAGDNYFVDSIIIEYSKNLSSWQEISNKNVPSPGKNVTVSDVLDMSGLTPGAYYLRAIAVDRAKNKSIPSEVVQVVTDSANPKITVTSPADKAYIGGNKVFSIKIEGNRNLSKLIFEYSRDKFNWTKNAEQAVGNETTTAEFTIDTTTLADGAFYVRVLAYDRYGRLVDGTPNVSYTIKNTNPEKPADMVVSAASSYIYLKWQPDYSVDFSGFVLYRAEVIEAITGTFSVLYSTDRYLGHYDYTVEQGKTYAYYLKTVNLAGLESAPTTTVIISPVPDVQKPAVTSVYPRNNGWLNNSAVISAGALDDYRLAELRLYSRAAGDTGANWTLLETKALSKATEIAEFKNWSSGITADGEYDFRFVATDSLSNVSDDYTIRYTVRNTPPADRVLSAINLDLAAGASWTKSAAETEIFGYIVSYSSNQSGPYSLVARLYDNATEYIIRNLDPGEYWIKVVTVDKAGNESAGTIIKATADKNDFENPVVVITAPVKALVNFPITLSGAESTDNDKIKTVIWNFGDGSTITDRLVVDHRYPQPGKYTVSLSAEDRQGNITVKTHEILVVPEGEMIGVEITVNELSVSGPEVPVAGAVVLAEIDGTDMTPIVTDSAGKVYIATDPGGSINVTATKKGYELARINIDLTNPDVGEEAGAGTGGSSGPGVFAAEQDAIYKRSIRMNRSDYLVGSLTVKRMDLEEIIAAGIDVSNPDNLFVWEFTIVHEFEGRKFEDVFPVNSGGAIVGGGGGSWSGGGWGGGWGWTGGGGGSGSGGGSWDYYFIPSPNPDQPPAVAYLTIYGGTHWLKEFFQVDLDLVNYAPIGFDLVNMKAELNLPLSGLSLAPLPTPQDKVYDIGLLEGDGGKASASWIVRGDKAGEYPISATVSGNWFDGEPIEKMFTSQQPIKVWAGSALELYVTAEDKAFPGHPYVVDFELVNVSDIALYNLEFEIYGGKITSSITQNDLENVSGIQRDGNKISVKEFLPGDTLGLTFEMTFTAQTDQDDLVYVLTNAFSFTREGSNTEVPVFFKAKPAIVPPEILKEKGSIVVYSYNSEFELIPVAGARISASDGKWWITNESGLADLNERWGYNADLTISREGYRSTTIKYSILKQQLLVYLEPINLPSTPGAGGTTTQADGTFNFNLPGIQVPATLELLGDREYKLDVFGVPMEIEITESSNGSKFRISLGTKDFWKHKNTELIFTNLKKAIAEASKDLSDAKKQYDKLAEVADAFGFRGQTIVNRANLGGGFEAKITVLGFVEGIINPDNSLTVTESGIAASINPKFEILRQAIFFAGPIPIPFVYGGEIGLKAGIEGKILLPSKEVDLSFEGEFSIEVAGYIGAGLGIAKIATVNLEFFGGGKYTAPISDPLSGEFKFEAGLRGTLRTFLFEAELELAKVTFPTKPGRSSAMYSSGYDFQPISRDYAASDSTFMANPIVHMFGVNPVGKITTTIKSNVFPYGEPAIADLGGGRSLLLWIDDDVSRSDSNRTALYYSYYNGSGWSQPEQVDDDGTPDFYPTVVSYDGNAYIAWMNADSLISGGDDRAGLMEMSQAMDISFATFSPASGMSEAINLSRKDVRELDMLPSIATNGSTVKVAWVTNESNDVFGSGLNAIYDLELTQSDLAQMFVPGGIVNVKPKLVDGGLPGISSLSIGFFRNEYTISYATAVSVSSDGIDGEHQYHTQVYVISAGPKIVLPSAEMADESPYVTDEAIYWFSGNQILYIEDLSNIEVKTALGGDYAITTGDYQILTNTTGDRAIVYLKTVPPGENNAPGTDITTTEAFAIFFDAVNGEWSAPVQITETNLTMSQLKGYMNENGVITLTYDAKEMIVPGDENNAADYGSSSLYITRITPSYNVEISSLVVQNELFGEQGDETLPVSFMVENTGEMNINSITAVVAKPDGTIIYTKDINISVPIGATTRIEFGYPLTFPVLEQNLIAYVYPTGASAAKSNSIEFVIGAPDISIVSAAVIEDINNYNFFISLNNYGMDAENVVVRLVYDSITGTAFHTEKIDVLEGYSGKIMKVSIEKSRVQIGSDGARAIYVVADPMANEISLVNNHYLLSINAPLPADAVVIDSITSANGTIEIKLNRKPDNAVALSDFTVKYSINNGSSKSLAVAAFNYDNDRTVTLSFAKFEQTNETQNVVISINYLNTGNKHSQFIVYALGAEPEKVAMPIANPPSGSVTAGTTVMLATTTAGATIYYTLDGSEPTLSSTVYTAPITINADVTIKAIAIKSGMTDSDVLAATYTIEKSLGSSGGNSPPPTTTTTTVPEVPPPLAWVNPFTDVAETDWFYEAIEYISEKGLMIGTSNSKFDPNAALTRAMIVTIIWRMEGSPEAEGLYSDFADVVQDSWYEKAVGWAAQNGIVLGFPGGIFKPNDPITREQAVTILYRYAIFKKLNVSAVADLSGYTDMTSVSAWALDAVKWAVAAGIIQGRTPVTIVPKGTSTRAEVATIFKRYIEDFLTENNDSQE